MTHPRWIVVTDTRSATMFSCRKSAGGEWHLENVGSIANEHDQSHQRGRPSELSGRGLGAAAHGAPHMAAEGRGDEEEHHRFALAVAGREGWLAHTLVEHKADRVHVFAPPAFLGALRKVMASKGHHDGGALIEKTTLLEGQFTNLHPGELATQPKIVQALTTVAQ